jgi:hypothetical protein
MRASRELVVHGSGLRASARKSERRAGGYVPSSEQLEIAEGALTVHSDEIERLRVLVAQAEEQMVASAEAWLEAQAQHFKAKRALERMIVNARRTLSKPTTTTGLMMGDPAPGRTPWA